MNDENWYMVVNTGMEMKDEWVELQSPAKSYVFLNAMNGKISKADKKGNSVRIQLNSEQSVFVKCVETGIDAPEFVYEESTQKPIKVGVLWKLEFLEGGPVYPGNLQLDDLMP